MKEKLAASLVIHRPREMGAKGREEIADWLQSQIIGLLGDGHNYAKTFTAKYFFVPKGKK